MSRSIVIAALLSPLLAGCVERTMTIKSDPPGALVYLNDQEVGRTPLKRDFTWYGDYDVQIRKEGYETLKMHQPVIAPWYEWVPFDLFAEMLPMRATDNHDLFFKLNPEPSEAAAPGPLLERAEDLKGQLEFSEHTRAPSTRPATRPAKPK
jgi:hypothetical protein